MAESSIDRMKRLVGADWFRPGPRRVCRSCGRSFVPVGVSSEVVCALPECAAWAERYADAIARGVEPPAGYSWPAARERLLAVERDSAHPSWADTDEEHRARRMLRRVDAISRGNELHQKMREEAALERGVETVSL
jgi:hypothetical protein